jgi:hypothetical protein
MALIPCYEFSEEQLQNCDALFPADVEDDLWIFYHATSSTLEDQIDSEGLGWRPRIYSKQDLEAIDEVYSTMKWDGIDFAGIPIIRLCSLRYDFGNSDLKPMYFRESSIRSLIYATSDWAGGESARAIRRAMHDLNIYLDDETVRQAHTCDLRMTISTKVAPVNLNWLAERIDELTPLWRRCEALKEKHRYGVVYAVRFEDTDLPYCSFDGGTGLRCNRQLDESRLVAKARLMSDAVDSGRGQCGEAALKNLRREGDAAGMLFALSKLKQTGDES